VRKVLRHWWHTWGKVFPGNHLHQQQTSTAKSKLLAKNLNKDYKLPTYINKNYSQIQAK